MSYVTGNSEQSSDAGDGLHTLAITGVTSGNFIVVAVRQSAALDVTAVSSDVDGAFTPLVTQADSGGGNEVEVWYLENATAGSHTITATVSQVTQTIRWIVAAYDNVPTASVIDDWDSGVVAASSTVTTNALTTTGADRVIVGIVLTNISVTTIGPSGSEAERFEVGARLQLQDVAAATAGDYTTGWTLGTTADNGWVALALKSPATASKGRLLMLGVG